MWGREQGCWACLVLCKFFGVKLIFDCTWIFIYLFSDNRFLGEAIDHPHLDARKGYWQADAHFVGGPGTAPLSAGEQQWACQAIFSRRAARHGKLHYFVCL